MIGGVVDMRVLFVVESRGRQLFSNFAIAIFDRNTLTNNSFLLPILSVMERAAGIYVVRQGNQARKVVVK